MKTISMPAALCCLSSLVLAAASGGGIISAAASGITKAAASGITNAAVSGVIKSAASGAQTVQAPAQAPAQPPAPQVSGWQHSAAARSPVEILNWTAPQPGWLYVLDPQPIPHSVTGRILLIDPQAGKIMGIIGTGFNPDFTLSPDGKRLYVASEGDGPSSNLAAIDTAAGTVLATASVDNRVAANGITPFSSMAVSGDGQALRILVNVPKSPDTDGFQLVTFNTDTGELLPGRADLGNCGYGRFIDYDSADQFDYLCPTTNRIRHIRANQESRDLDNAFVVFPWERRLGVAQAFLSRDGKSIDIVRGDGAIYSMDVATATFSATPVHGDIQGRILPAPWPVSPDGKRLYVGYSHLPNPKFYLNFGQSAAKSPRTQTVPEIRVCDTSTWRKIAHIKTRAPIWTATVSRDGKLLYATSPESHSILVINTATERESSAIQTGGTPALILLAP